MHSLHGEQGSGQSAINQVDAMTVGLLAAPLRDRHPSISGARNIDADLEALKMYTPNSICSETNLHLRFEMILRVQCVMDDM